MTKILIVEDDVAFCTMLKTFLQKKGYEATTAFSGKDARTCFESMVYDVMITDVRLPDKDGLWLLEKIKRHSPTTQVILMTGYAEVHMAVEAIKKGAYDYLSKPFPPTAIIEVIEKALKHEDTKGGLSSSLENSNSGINSVASQESEGIFVRGIGDASKKLNEYIGLVAPTQMSVLIIGASGTGKEYVASSIHQASKRASNSFVAVDCGAIPKELASSEFFGHIKGSFTGAVNDKTGHFEAANGGTLFLDEIGNLSYELQVQLLRALQERRIKPVGSNKEIAVDIRVIAATNEDLAAAVRQGDFREDLYHRLNEFSITVPPLQERKEDLMLFANFFLSKANRELEKHVVGFSDEALLAFKNYSWPGNLRELKNVVKRAVLLTGQEVIPIEVLPSDLLAASSSNRKSYTLFKNENEQQLILDTLEAANGNKAKAARMLDIDRKTLYNKLRQYGIRL